jgi:hypothetical protein
MVGPEQGRSRPPEPRMWMDDDMWMTGPSTAGTTGTMVG